MSLVQIDLPTPRELRGGWVALAAVYASLGWSEYVYANSNQWLYHYGGGNWVCLRFKEKDKSILIGHDHECSETYFGEAAKYFEEEETNLLEGTPEWWEFNISPLPFGDWIGFVYGWDNEKWQRANYDKPDGFQSIGLLNACSIKNINLLKDFANDAPGLNGQPPNTDALIRLVAADANITFPLLEAVVPGWNIDVGITTAQKFLEADL